MKTKSILSVFLFLISFVPLAFTHPASKVDLSYHLEDHILTVVAEHDTKDITKHRIDQIIVQLNGNEIIQQTFAIQFDQEMQKATYLIPDAKAGDEIVVIARCSVYGKKKAKIKIESE
jgi:uncharacterized membrane protein